MRTTKRTSDARKDIDIIIEDVKTKYKMPIKREVQQGVCRRLIDLYYSSQLNGDKLSLINAFTDGKEDYAKTVEKVKERLASSLSDRVKIDIKLDMRPNLLFSQKEFGQAVKKLLEENKKDK